MVNLAENNKLVADNEVVIGGLKYMLTDDETIKLNDIIKGMISTRDGSMQNTTIAPSKASKGGKKPFKGGKAKDIEVNMKATKKVVSIDGYVGKDVWEVLKRRYEVLGGKYNKNNKTIEFGTEKNAKEFASNPSVTAEERENVWKEWRA